MLGECPAPLWMSPRSYCPSWRSVAQFVTAVFVMFFAGFELTALTGGNARIK